MTDRHDVAKGLRRGAVWHLAAIKDRKARLDQEVEELEERARALDAPEVKANPLHRMVVDDLSRERASSITLDRDESERLLAEVIQNAACVRCGTPGIVSEDILGQSRDQLASIHEQVPGDRVMDVRVVAWCDDCGRDREQWITAFEAVRAGTATPEQEDSAREGRATALRIRGDLIERGGGAMPAIGGGTRRFLEAAGVDMNPVTNADIVDSLVTPTGDYEDTKAWFHRVMGFPGVRWAGTHSLSAVRAACIDNIVREWVYDPTAGQEVATSAAAVYLNALKVIDQAHPIVFPPAQADVLPEESHEGIHEYGQTLRLPFPVVYLDFTDDRGKGVTGEAPVTIDGDTVESLVEFDLLGTLLWEADQRGTVSMWSASFYRTDDGIRTPGAAILNARTVEGDVTVDDVDGLASVFIRGMSVILSRDDAPGWLIPALPAADHVGLGDPGRHAQSAWNLGMLSALTWATHSVAIRALMFLDSANVEIATATLPRRDRKRADKRGWPTASTIAIRHRVTRPGVASGGEQTGAAREYATRFEVTGHYHHVTRGSHVQCPDCRATGELETWQVGGVPVPSEGVYHDGDSYVNAERAVMTCTTCNGTGLDPTKVKPCLRRDSTTGVLTCPHGCRREWVKAHPKGNPDAPLRLKTRRVPS